MRFAHAVVACSLAAACSDGTSPVFARLDAGTDAAPADDVRPAPDVRPDGQDVPPDADALPPGDADAAADVDVDAPDTVPADTGSGRPEPLCGEVEGSLAATDEPWTLSCDVVVPAGKLLLLAPGATLDLGAHSVAVRGTLELAGEGVSLDLTGSGSVTVQEGGLARLRNGARVRSLVPLDGAAAVRLVGGTLEAEGAAFTDAAGSGTGLSAGEGARFDLTGGRFEGFWVALAAGADSAGSLSGTTFDGCATAVRTLDRAFLDVTGCTFSGQGFHVVLDPDFFSVGGAGALADNVFDPAGVPLLLAGTVDGEARIGPVAGLAGLDLLDVEVPAGAALTLEAGLVLRLLGGGLRVAGRLDATGVVFPDLAETALRFEPGSSATMSGGELSSAPVAGVTLVEVAGGAPLLDGVLFVDAGGNAECLGVTGEGSAPEVRGASFDGCWVAVRADGLSEPRIVEGDFTGHGTGVLLDGAPGAEVRGNRFSGEGVHVYASPRAFAAESLPSLEDNDFGEAGTPLVVAGVLEAGEARLRPLLPDVPLALGTLQVGAGALLTAGPDLEVVQDGTSIIVEGSAALHGVRFVGLAGPAVEFREDAGGGLTGCRLELAGGAPFPGLRVTDASPSLEGNTFAGAAGSGATGVLVSGTAGSPVVAAPLVAGNAFSDLRVGVVVTGDAAPVFEDNVFERVATEVQTP